MMASVRIISKMEKETIFRNRRVFLKKRVFNKDLFNLQSYNYSQEKPKLIIIKSTYTFIDAKYLKQTLS